MFGFGKKEEKSDLFQRFSIDFSKKYGEGGYGATFAAQDKASGEKLATDQGVGGSEKRRRRRLADDTPAIERGRAAVFGRAAPHEE